jgi:arylsulfatase A-like enzyme
MAADEEVTPLVYNAEEGMKTSKPRNIVERPTSRAPVIAALIISLAVIISIVVVVVAKPEPEPLYTAMGEVYTYAKTTMTGKSKTLDTDLAVTGGRQDTTTTTQESSTKPNFVMIVADDLGWNSLGYNDDEMAFATPIMTNMARKGITMGNYYAQEVCSPSRGSLLTGRYPLSIGMQYGMVAANAEWGMSLDETTLAQVLSDNDYATHMLGKWHLGYFTPNLLPTARGFSTFTGYLNGENYYWSKRSTDYPEHVDFLDSNTKCYSPYNGTDLHHYSTTFYTNHALTILDSHTPSEPLFLYLSYQAVHDPFIDYGKHSAGMPDEYLSDDVLKTIHTTITGSQRQEYVKALYMLDQSIGKIYGKLSDKGMIDNTYIIFMSDNGGCFYGGGRNGPLRGSKGSLFEGGIKVDSWVYSPKLQNAGSVYNGLMHVSDWFPTILALAEIDYTPDDGFELDGVNQVVGWSGGDSPRSIMLYNMYTHLTDYNFNIWYNGSFAVRDQRFKLMHTYNDSDYGAWYSPDVSIENDDELDSDNRCAQQFLKGEFTYFLYDLDEDPYEKNNLYYSTQKLHTDTKERLYKLLPAFDEKAKTKIKIEWSNKAEKVWSAAGNHIVPWADTDSLENDGDHPEYCPNGLG